MKQSRDSLFLVRQSHIGHAADTLLPCCRRQNSDNCVCCIGVPGASMPNANVDGPADWSVLSDDAILDPNRPSQRSDLN
jgi:hypothetical protein